MPRLPLTGIRIADLTMNWSGPYATEILAGLGAEVIKIESIQRPDIWRGAAASLGKAEKYWERSPLWNAVNLDKYDITLDLNRPKGQEIFKRLVKISDVVAENYTPRVMENFGLTYPVLKEANPRIIMISMPALGSTGPWRNHPGFGISIEQMAGIPQLTGYPDGPPMMAMGGPSDPIVAVNTAFAILTALKYRQRTGKGQRIDLSQVEALTCIIGDAIVDYAMNNRVQPKRGNRHPFMAPHGYYRCKGEDLWVLIAISSDEEWMAFCEAIGNPLWSQDKRFTDVLGRLQNQEDLDRLIEEWTIKHDHYEVMNTLQRVGVAAGAVLTSAELLEDAHLKERGFFQRIDRAEVGTHPYPIPTAPMRFSRAPISISKPAPFLGEDNDYVYGQLLGMSKEEIQSLVDDHMIGTALFGPSFGGRLRLSKEKED